jgi:hypothetical protein
MGARGKIDGSASGAEIQLLSSAVQWRRGERGGRDGHRVPVCAIQVNVGYRMAPMLPPFLDLDLDLCECRGDGERAKPEWNQRGSMQGLCSCARWVPLIRLAVRGMCERHLELDGLI